MNTKKIIVKQKNQHKKNFYSFLLHGIKVNKKVLIFKQCINKNVSYKNKRP